MKAPIVRVPIRPPERLDWKIASMTGHRKFGPGDKERVWAAMRALVANPSIDAIYFGGAAGADTEALKACLASRTGKRPWLVVVVPDTVEKQPYAVREWIRKADEVIELRKPITPDDRFESYLSRNRYLVDIATFLIAFWNGDYKTGTGHAVRCAEKDGLQVVKVKMATPS